MIHEFYLENWKEYEEIYKEWQDKAKENFACLRNKQKSASSFQKKKSIFFI